MVKFILPALSLVAAQIAPEEAILPASPRLEAEDFLPEVALRRPEINIPEEALRNPYFSLTEDLDDNDDPENKPEHSLIDILMASNDPRQQKVSSPIYNTMTDEEEDAIWQQVYATGPRAIGKAYIDADPSIDISKVTCRMSTKMPDNGTLQCPNATPAPGGKGTLAAANDVCRVRCDKGYKPNTEGFYNSLKCEAKENTRSGAVVGVWSERRPASCVKKGTVIEEDQDEPVIEIPSPTPQPIITNSPRPTISQPSEPLGYFPSSYKKQNLPNNYQDLSNKIKFTQEEIDNLPVTDLFTNHNIILPSKQCVVCSNTKSMKKCVMQRKTCQPSSNQVCFTEIKKSGMGVVINRGCQERSVCLNNYFDSINFAGDYEKLSGNGDRPDAQCRYMARTIAKGDNRLSSDFVKQGKSCYSCHSLAFSVPYL